MKPMRKATRSDSNGCGYDRVHFLIQKMLRWCVSRVGKVEIMK